MTVTCLCNVLSNRHFDAAIIGSNQNLAEAPSLKNATVKVYHDARLSREAERHLKLHKPCRICFSTVAAMIQKNGHFQNEPIPVWKAPCKGCKLEA